MITARRLKPFLSTEERKMMINDGRLICIKISLPKKKTGSRIPYAVVM